MPTANKLKVLVNRHTAILPPLTVNPPFNYADFTKSSGQGN